MQRLLILRVILMILFVALLSGSLSAQDLPTDRPMVVRRGRVRSEASRPASNQQSASSTPRGYARYTATDWRKLIDSVWGPGLPTDQKLQIFDGFWNTVDQKYGGFPNLNLNWDSLKTVYRAEIAQGVSRGRFAGLMSFMYLSLRETHSSIVDLGIDSAFISTGEYQPRGIPLVILSGLGRTGLGATLTPLPDSSLLVLQSDPHQPMGLQAGDIVLGYDGVPWKQLIRQLMDSQLPVASSYNGYSYWCSSPESWSHNLLASAASNWHLFDSLDVVKYATGEIVHLTTSILDTTYLENFVSVEQLPVKGVPTVASFPDGPQCTWGVVDGTNVGYIYIRNWTTATASLVSSAVDDLTRLKKTDGLIIDSRVNMGGSASLFTALGPLFNNDPFTTLSIASRTSASDRMGFILSPFAGSIPPKEQFYDRPIAVLTGPECYSAGDYAAFFLRSHPMVRFFGKPTNTAYVSGGGLAGYYFSNLWYYGVSGGGLWSNYPGERFLVHKGFDVDERVWFTKDDAAKGDDTVVKRALQWIAGLSYGHNVVLTKNAGKPGQDTIRVTATVENPQKHTLAVWSYLTNRSGLLIDSCQTFDDGLHSDGIAGDKVYGGTFRYLNEGAFEVSLRTVDATAGTSRYLSNTQWIWTNGPIIGKGWSSTTADTIPNPGDVLRLKFNLANSGKSDTVKSVTATVSTLDTMVFIGSSVQISYGDMAPGAEASGSTSQALRIQPYCPPNTKVRLLLTISTEGFVVWIDTISMMVQAAVTGVADKSIVPKEYSLSQNYPNPFNPSTMIRYELPKSANVSLKVFNSLGQIVATLVGANKDAGFYQVHWNASSVPSGIYFYRLQAGEFVETKKMILVR